MSLAYTAIALSAISVGISAYNTYQAKEAGEDAEDAARAEKDRARAVKAEQNKVELATVRARAAASGTSGLSESIFLQDLKRAGIEELDWLNTVGDFNITATQNETDLAVTKGISNTLNSAGSVARMLAKPQAEPQAKPQAKPLIGGVTTHRDKI